MVPAENNEKTPFLGRFLQGKMMSNFSFRGATTFNWNNDPVAPRIEAVEISALYKGKAKQLIPTPTPVMKRPTKNTPTPQLL